jgi:hypothetical protein
MNTQNVNVKTAAQERSERYGWTENYGWGLSPSQRIAEQQGYLNRLRHFNDQWLPEKSQRLTELLMAIAQNVLDAVTNWKDVGDFGDKPCVPYAVARCWLDAMALAPQMCGEIGAAAVVYVRNDLARNFEFESTMALMDRT